MKKTILLFTLLTLVAFSSCDKDASNKEDWEKDEWEKDWDKEKDEDDKECFHFVYPITFIMPDGSTIAGDEETVWAAIEAWYESYPDVDVEPILSFPVDLIFEYDDESKTVTVNNEDELEDLEKDCYDEKEWEDCIQLIYPVTYTLPDGSSISGDKETVWAAIKTWYEAHPDVEAKPALNYPVDIIFDDDENITIHNEDEMIDLKKDCYEKDDEDCFDVVYPITYTMPDNTSITGANDEELWTAIKAWYEAHPDVAEKATLNYPVEIIFEDQTTQAIANEEEMTLAKKDCEEEN